MDTTDLQPELTDREFEIVVRRLADDLRHGLDSSPYLGQGIDYLQSRPFVDGDPVKDIDWRVTARTGRFHVKEYEALKSMPVYLLVDTSASMALSSRALSKQFLSVLIAGGLALAAIRHQSPVGLLAGGDRELHFPPSLSRANLFQWLHSLRRRELDERTLLGRRLDEVGGFLRSCGLVIVISDLHDPGVVPAAKRLVQRHDCMVLHLEDPAERGRLKGGFFRGVEAETGLSFTGSGWSRWFNGFAKRPAPRLRSAGIDYMLLSTDRPFVAPLRRFLADRNRRTRNQR